MKSTMKSSNYFAQAPKVDIQRSTFDMSHGFKTTHDFDDLIPIELIEVLPGDTFNLKCQVFGRLATPINPIMDNMQYDVHWFFVPNRLLWDNWEKFCGAQDSPGDSTDYAIPTRALTTGLELTVCDYLGLPIDAATPANIDVNVLPLRAYHLIFDEWYRDQNLATDADIVTADSGGNNVCSNGQWYQLRKRGKRHDYFTSCLPWTQKINDGYSVNVPLAGEAWVTGIGILSTDNDAGSAASARDSYEGNVNTSLDSYSDHYTSASDTFLMESNGSDIPQVRAVLDSATGASINQLRLAFQVQKYFEKDARSGTRYNEKVYGHFGVTVPDYRIQRPEFLGGSTDYISVSPVAQTSSTDATTPQGNLSAVGTVSSRSGFTKSFTEHGYVLGIASARADLTYQQGLHKLWSRSTVYDFYWPSFANLGEQAVLTQEIYAQGSASDDPSVFGYQERYAEYRYMQSQITGLFRSTHGTSLDSWHLSQEFSSKPELNEAFIQSNTPVDRVIAVTTEPHLIIDGYVDIKAARPMPVHSVPGLIDHF
jgi:hypothetical protein